MSLYERLRERIEREGPMSFRDFMAAALYDSQDGYYARGASIGERGDFVTSPHIAPAFAGAIARRLSEDAAKIPGPIDFVELGAGDGRFLEDLSGALVREAPGVAARLRLTAIERSDAARQQIASRPISPAPRLLDSAEGLALLLSHWRKICGKQQAASRVIDPMAEREKRYDALAEHYRSNLKMDVIYRALDGQR